MPTFDTGHLLATSFVEEGELAGDWVEHLNKIGQKQDDLHFVIGQVTATADALSPLNMMPTQESNCGTLVQIFGSESGRNRDITKLLFI